MNWGKGIVIGMVLFMGFIITLVVIMMRQKIDLVQEDYYQQEINYNQRYDAEQAYAQANDSITVNVVGAFLQIKLGQSFLGDSVKIDLKRPNDQEQDLNFALRAQPEIQLPIDKLPKGTFECQINGFVNAKAYFYKKNIYIP